MASSTARKVGAISAVLLTVAGGWFGRAYYDKTVLINSEIRFVQAFKAYQKSAGEQIASTTMEGPDPELKKAGLYAGLAGDRGIGPVTQTCMSLRPELRKVALQWAEAESKTHLLQSKWWSGMHKLVSGNGDSDRTTREIEESLAERSEAEAEADHLWNMVLGLLSAEAKSELNK